MSRKRNAERYTVIVRDHSKKKSDPKHIVEEKFFSQLYDVQRFMAKEVQRGYGAELLQNQGTKEAEKEESKQQQAFTSGTEGMSEDDLHQHMSQLENAG